MLLQDLQVVSMDSNELSVEPSILTAAIPL